jgi:hypothetical protein
VTARLDPLSLGIAAAITAALVMLVLGIAGNVGIYESAVDMMAGWHVFFSISVGGIIAGMLEAAVISFVVVYFGTALYNTLATRRSRALS